MNKLDEMRQNFKDEADQSCKDRRISEQIRRDRSAKIIAIIAAIAAVVVAITAIIGIWFAWESH
jgi:hypothetical protein